MALTKYRQRRTDQLHERVLELREQGKTFDQICSELHTTIRTVRHVLYAPEAERERLRRAHERTLALLPKAERAIERRLDEGDGTLGLRLLESVGVVSRAAAVQVTNNTQVNINEDAMDAARAVIKQMQLAQRRAADNTQPQLPEATGERLT